MEDIILLLVVFVVVVGITYLFKYIQKRHEANLAEIAAKQKAADEYWEKQRKKNKEAAQARTLAAATPPRTLNTVASGSGGRSTYLSSPTQEVQSYSTRSVLDDIADVAMIANTVRHWNDNERSESVREERSVGVSTRESSWGFDDSDSRKSVSDTFGGSSWSSSSDSSSSWSSDSGPSSDW